MNPKYMRSRESGEKKKYMRYRESGENKKYICNGCRKIY